MATSSVENTEFDDFETLCSQVDGRFHGRKVEIGSGSIPEIMPMFNAYFSAELDVDVLILLDQLLAVYPQTSCDERIDKYGTVRSKNDPAADQRQLDLVDIVAEETAEGYVRLRRRSNACYLAHSELHRKGSRFAFNDSLTLDSRGPALTIDLPSSVLGPGSPIVLTGFDHVFFIPCMQWPTIAEEWTTRMRPSGWPSKSLVARCVDVGCLFVPASHMNSKKPENEFRYSFSFAEMLLVRSWKPLQKFVYNTLKQLKNKVHKTLQNVYVNTELREKIIKCLSSYHMKTVILWACEEHGADFWREDDVETVLQKLVDMISQRLRRRNCPNYFMRSVNLFEQLDVDDVIIVSIVDALREQVQRLCDGTVTKSYLVMRYTTVIIPGPVSIAHWLRLLNVDPTVAAKASMFELYDLYRALQFQKAEQEGQQVAAENVSSEVGDDSVDRETAAERHFKLATRTDFPLVSLQVSCWDDMVSSAANYAVYWDESFEQLMTPLTERRDDGYPALLASKLCSKLEEIDEFYNQLQQRENEYNSTIVSNTIDWKKISQAAYPVAYCWFCTMAYYANYKYMQSTKAGFARAIELCDEATDYHAKLERENFTYCWYYEGCFAVTLSNRLSRVYDDLVQAVISGAAGEHSQPVAICPISFMHYIKVRCRQSLNAPVDDVIEAWQKHVSDYRFHKKYYNESADVERSLMKLVLG